MPKQRRRKPTRVIKPVVEKGENAGRPLNHAGGQGSKRRRKELRAAQFGTTSTSEVDTNQHQHGSQLAENDDDTDHELSAQSSDCDVTPYEKLIGILRPDVDEKDTNLDLESGDDDVNGGSNGSDGSEEDIGGTDIDVEQEGQDEEQECQDDRDGPEALRELGLDATELSADDEESDMGDIDEGEISDSFFRNFQNMRMDEASAKAFDETRNSIKWRRREIEGVPCPILWRAGEGCSRIPSAIDEGDSQNILNLEAKLYERWRTVVEQTAKREPEQAENESLEKRDSTGLTQLQRGLLPILNEYLDLLYCRRKPGDAEQLREMLVLHTLNHITKSRQTVQKNNALLKKRPDTDARDQGFTRCKVLVLLPCRNSAYLFIQKLLSLTPSACPPSGRVDGLDRFEAEFGPGSKAERRADRDKLMPTGEDHFERFHGNVDDHFRVGVQLHVKYARLFAPFYASDLIVASPLGLRMIVKCAGDKGREYDFLSSIEVLVVDQLDYLLMQNVEHLYTVIDAINKPPQQPRGVDFSRLREPFLDDTHKFLRQTIILAAHSTPEGNALVARHSFNVRGVVKTEEVHKGSIRHVLDQIQARQTFHRLDESRSLAATDEARFAFFREHIYRRLSQTSQTHTLLVVPSYMQFVQLRNFLNKEEASWQECTEYSSVTQVAHARSCFFHARCDLLVMTERFHFYHRFKLRGVRHVIFYGLPQFANFYPELVNLVSLGQERGVSVTSVYSPLDKLMLERIVGTRRAHGMLSSQKRVHLFA